MIKKFKNLIKESPGLLVIIIFGAVVMKYGFNEGTEDYRVIDGDTIVLNGEKVRLNAIDAPEIKQICRDYADKEIECGKIAKEKLREIIGHNKVKCDIKGKDLYNRSLGYCYVGNININKEMVRRGYAYARYSKIFINEEKEAKKKGVFGLVNLQIQQAGDKAVNLVKSRIEHITN